MQQKYLWQNQRQWWQLVRVVERFLLLTITTLALVLLLVERLAN